MEKQSKWWQSTVIYQIYPRSFYDSNGDGLGDLQGIIEKLDYLRELGVETLWISPFFKSPQQDFGYDIADYYAIAPEYGGLDSVRELINQVHKRKMRIVFDMVLNHTSIEHPWFTTSAQSRGNDKSDWYIWRDGKGKKPPNNWKSMTGGSGWHYHAQRGQWYFASFLPFQPDLNYHNRAVKKAMFDMLEYWLEQGVDGFRLDIFNAIYKDVSMKNNPFSWRVAPSESNAAGFFQNPVYTINHSQNFELAVQLRALLNRHENEPFAIGEVFGSHEQIKQYLGKKNDGLNLLFLFDMLRFRFNARFFGKQLERYQKHYSKPHTPVLVFGNHDRSRYISRLGGNMEKAKLIAFFQLTARGVPVIYMGEEMGMNNARIPLKIAKDPLAKKFDWLPQWLANKLPVSLNRDECRTPMQWSNAANAGFCPENATPWLPVNPDFKTVNIQTQGTSPLSLLNTYKNLLRFRQQRPVLQNGDLQIIDRGQLPLNVLAYQRLNESEKLTIFINFSNKDKPLPSHLTQGKVLLQVGGGFNTSKGMLRACSTCVFGR